jgi:hypothetical protein
MVSFSLWKQKRKKKFGHRCHDVLQKVREIDFWLEKNITTFQLPS